MDVSRKRSRLPPSAANGARQKRSDSRGGGEEVVLRGSQAGGRVDAYEVSHSRR
jgi:hypothetical protein